MARKRSQVETVLGVTEENKSQRKRKKRKRNENSFSLASNSFKEIYDLSEVVLGQGAYAVVRSCTNKMTGQVYAVKMIEKVVGYSRARVLREIELNYKCQGHNNIIQLIEFFEEEDKFYLVFEKAYGGQLTDQLAKKGRFTEDEARNIFLDISTALAFLHQRGVAHRDLKPENILCSSTEEIFPVKLCDFDLGSLCDSSAVTVCPDLTSLVGSAEFMAPEIVRAFGMSSGGVVRYSKQCDVWSLGVLLFILVTGTPPFQGSCGRSCGWDQGESCEDCLALLFKNIYQGKYCLESGMWEFLSEEIKDLVRKLLVKDPDKRLLAEEVLEHPWLSIKKDVLPGETKISNYPTRDCVRIVKSLQKIIPAKISDDGQKQRRRKLQRTGRNGRQSVNRRK